MKKRIAVWTLLTLLVPIWCGTARAFSDVPDSHWASAEIRYVVERGLFNGRSETIFAPSDGMTRGQMCAVLYRYAGSPVVSGTLSYEDVQPGRYYYDAILWARENTILTESKLSARFFRPDETITRAEFALMLYQFNLYEGGSAFDSAAVSESKMTDMDMCGSAVRNAMLGWAYPAGVLRGTSEATMNPSGTLTRAHVAAILYRYDTSVRTATAAPAVPPSTNAETPASGGTDNNNSTVPTGYQIVADIPSSMEVRSRMAVTPKTNPVQERCAWSVASSNEAVLAVEKSGDGNTLLVARSAGTAVVTVTNTADGKAVSVSVTVQDRATDALDLNANMEMRLEIVRLTNELRREKGLNELVVNDALMNAAQEYAMEHPADHDFNLSGKLCAKYEYQYSYGENLAWNFTSAKSVIQGWKNSPGHYQTMLRERYDEIGIGVSDNGCFAMILGDWDQFAD